MLEEAGIPAEMVDVESDDTAETTEEKLDEFKRFLEDVDPEDFQG